MKERNNELEEVKWGGLINEFFWICAGVNRAILRQCPTDYAKYAGIGGTILFTALMAMLSGGYAMFFVFKHVEVAIAFGVFWGMLIFNLDRFIVNTMYSDGKVTISWGEFGAGLPRIIMAIFLGVIISTPLELKIFESEINVKLDNLKEQEIEQYVLEDKHDLEKKESELDDLRNSPLTTAYDALTGNNQIDKILNLKNTKIGEYNNAVAQRKQAWNEWNSYPDNDSTQNRRNHLFQRYLQFKNITSSISAEIAELEAKKNAIQGYITNATSTAEDKRNIEIARLQTEIDTLEIKIANGEASHNAIVEENYGGFQGRMLAFGELKNEHETTKWSAWFIMILFIIIIETAPTFFKMMIASGPYDDLLRSEMHKARVMSDKRISDLNDEINTEIMISTERNNNKLEAEVAANKELLNRIALVQAELLSTAIEKWREEELRKISENPSAYIKTSSENHEK